MNKLLLLIMLMPLFVVAQQDKPQPADYFAQNIIKPKGNVKSLTIYEKKLFDSDSSFYKKFGYINTRQIHWNDRQIYTIKYFPDGRIETYIGKDSTKQKLWHNNYVYDVHNNIIELDRYWANGVKHIMKSFHYDSLGRWIETREYDTANKPNNVHKRIYKNNKVVVLTYYNTSLAKGKIVYEYEKNKTTKLTYHSDNEYCDKYIEKIKGNTIYRQTDWISPKDGSLGSQDLYQSNLTEGSSSEISYNGNKEILVTRQQWKYNEYGDKTVETIFRSGFSYQTTFHNGTLNKTYKYDYDSHGNYTKKTEYIDGVPAYETTRTIEYYD